MDAFFKIFILSHAFSGFVALFAGTISIIARKGNEWHKKAGIIFYYGMIVAGGSGLVAALLPGHLNPFLFVVALFTLYLTITGYRALNLKNVREKSEIRLDYIYSYAMLTIALGMIFFGVNVLVKGQGMGWVLIVFGTIGILNALADVRAYRDLKSLRKKSLRLHIGKITGAYIAAFTAFFVTNDVLPSVLSWLLPTIFGVIFITYWLRKTKVKKKPTTHTL